MNEEKTVENEKLNKRRKFQKFHYFNDGKFYYYTTHKNNQTI